MDLLNILLGILGAQEIIIIAIIILLLFGGRKIPELMRGLGRGMKEFKDATAGKIPDDEDTKDDSKE
jgi:sec-independent protein translocase protein TatA